MNYLHLTIWLVCLYDAIILLLLPSTVTILFTSDGSSARYVVNFVALGLAMYALCNDGLKKLPNQAFGLFVLLMVISSAHSPNIQFESLFVPKDSAIFNFKPMFEILVFFLMFMGIYSLNVSREATQKVYKALAWLGVVSSIYIICQRVGMDQLYKMVATGHDALNSMTRNPEAGAFIGQPVFASCLIVMCLPFIVKQKEWIKLAVCMVAIYLTGNRTALLASAFVLMYAFDYTRRASIILFPAVVLSIVGLVVTNFFVPSFEPIHFTGRMLVWQQIITDLVNNPFPGISMSHIITGLGIGSFPITFPFYHHSGFYQAHNEYLEVFRGLGIAGLVVLFFIIKHIISYTKNVELKAALLGVSICALFNPVWHNPQIAFVTVFILALYYKGVPHDMETRRANGCAKLGKLRESEDFADLPDFRFAGAGYPAYRKT